MNELVCKISVKTLDINIDKIKSHIKEKECIVKQNADLQYKDHLGQFYDICFKRISIDNLEIELNTLNKIAVIQKVEIYFKHSSDCLELLQAKGFKKYEDIDYVDFKYPLKNIQMSLLKEEGLYRFSSNRVIDNRPISVPFFIGSIKRVFDIIEGGK